MDQREKERENCNKYEQIHEKILLFGEALKAKPILILLLNGGVWLVNVIIGAKLSNVFPVRLKRMVADGAMVIEQHSRTNICY